MSDLRGPRAAGRGRASDMSWYAETPALRTRQLVLDGLVLLWVVIWVRVGAAVHDAVSHLAAPGRSLEQAGRDLADGLSGAAERAGDVPLLGDELSSPLDSASGAGESLARAGQVQQDAVGLLALVLTLVVAGLPVLVVGVWWLRSRLAFARDHAAARALRADEDLWALRAALTRPLPELARLGPDPVTRWRHGDPGAGAALAALERRAAGLRR